MFSIKELQQKVAEPGLRLGAIPARIVFERGLEQLLRREKDGWKTPFATGNPEVRCQPLKMFPQARTVVTVAYSWYFPADEPPGLKQGTIAMSGRGEDYHRVLTRLLEPLAEWLKDGGASWAIIQVDNGPLLEREAAFWSGLGYYGYNCSFIVPGLGSRVALGLIVTDLDLEPTFPEEEKRCKGCGRCLTACPTGALISPYTLHPERCLSYLTQKRGFLPRELRPYLGQRLFGCDVCQDVCPENEGLNLAGSPFEYPDLVQILTMDRQRFNELFGSMALAWRGKSILQRNAAIALGNARCTEEAALCALEEALTSPSPTVRGHAAWALGKLGIPRVRKALTLAYGRETDAGVRQEIREALDKV